MHCHILVCLDMSKRFFKSLPTNRNIFTIDSRRKKNSRDTFKQRVLRQISRNLFVHRASSAHTRSTYYGTVLLNGFSNMFIKTMGESGGVVAWWWSGCGWGAGPLHPPCYHTGCSLQQQILDLSFNNTWHQCWGSKYIEFRSGSRVMLSILKTNIKKILENKYF